MSPFFSDRCLVSSARSTASPSSGPGAFEDACAFIEERLLDGVRHGFFSLSIDVETEAGGRRAVTVRCGTSHRFIIRKEEIPA